MHFHPRQLRLFIACDSHTIKSWQLETSEVNHIYDSDVATVTSISFLDEETLISAGRDSVLLIWKIDENEPSQTIAAYEPIEDLKIYKNHIYTAGSRG